MATKVRDNKTKVANNIYIQSTYQYLNTNHLNTKSFRKEEKQGESKSKLGQEFNIFGAEEIKKLLPNVVITRWILNRLLDEECLQDLVQDKVAYKDRKVVNILK